jgi:hypothetical protein
LFAFQPVRFGDALKVQQIVGVIECCCGNHGNPPMQTYSMR